MMMMMMMMMMVTVNNVSVFDHTLNITCNDRLIDVGYTAFHPHVVDNE